MDKSIFAKRLRDTRISKQLTQQATADKLEIDIRTYQYYEEVGQNAYPLVPTLATIGVLFNVSLDYLVGNSDNPKMRKK